MLGLAQKIQLSELTPLWRLIQANPDKPWEWYYISQNPNITWQIIQDNLDNPWDWRGISTNPNITWQIVQDNPDKYWDWGYISQNKFTTELNEIKLQLQINAANRIRNWYLNIYMRPDIYAPHLLAKISELM